MIDFLKTLLEISFISSIMIVIVFGIRYFLSKKMNPIIIYVLWLIVLIRLIVPVTINSPVHLYGLFAAVENGKQDTVNIETTESTSSDVSYNTEPNTYASMEIDDFTEPDAVVSREKITYTLWEKIAKNIKSISLWDVLGVIWISGVIAAIFITGKKVLLFKRRIMAHSYESDELIKRIVYRQLANSGIKKSIRIYTCEQADVPMIFGYFKPILIIPKGLLKTLDKDKIELIILHEIGHVRRHDILFSYLWLAAKIIHWFNPMIWMANKLYKDDVEFCCDQWVINRLKEKNKFDYGQALIDAARMSKASGLLPVTVAFFEDKYKLKERVNRMVGLRQKSKSAIIITSILSFIMVVMCFTTACQPTPETQPVVARDNAENIVEEMMKSGTEVPVMPIEEYISSESIQESFSVVEDILEVSIDADVLMPNIEKFPIGKIKSADFTQDEVDKLLEYFMQGGELVSPYVPTKEYFDNLIVQQKRGHIEDGKYVFNDADKQMIEELEEQRKNAPSEDIREPITDCSIDGEEGLYARIISDGNSYGTIYATEKRFQYLSNYEYEDEAALNILSSISGISTEIPTTDMTEDDAINKATTVLTDLDIQGFAVKGIEKVYLYESNNFIENNSQELNAGNTGYRITFMREFGGMMPELTMYSEISDTDQYDYISPFGMEYILILVDDNGNIHQFIWRDPSKIVETMVENIELIPFDDILQRLKNYAKFHWSWLGETGGEFNYKEVLYIDSISLNLYCLPIKDSSNEYMYAPCWFFTYSTRYYFDSENYEESSQRQHIIFNGIDGGSVSAYPASALESMIDSGV